MVFKFLKDYHLYTHLWMERYNFWDVLQNNPRQVEVQIKQDESVITVAEQSGAQTYIPVLSVFVQV